jgi:hypothetical protein
MSVCIDNVGFLKSLTLFFCLSLDKGNFLLMEKLQVKNSYFLYYSLYVKGEGA